MNSMTPIRCILAGLLLNSFTVFGEDWYCGRDRLSAPVSAADSNTRRHYAPSREIKIRHLALDITPDFPHRSISGSAVLAFSPIALPLAELKLDAVDLRVESVTSSETLQAWQSTGTEIRIQFATEVPVGKESTVTVHYSASPRHGLYFRTPELGYPAGDSHLWSQGEPIESRHWFPSFDAPNEKFTSELTCRVPDGMTVISNGRRVSSQLDPATGLRAVRWLQDKPHANYLIALAAGYLKGIESKYREIPIALYTPASQVGFADTTFAGTAEMLAFFEQETGVLYPWDKYYQVCVSDYHWGGMENTTMTILNEGTLYPEGFESLRSSESLVAHELAHQWFGDLVTCKDWSHLWLNEGFATYYDALYQGHKHGSDEFLYTMYQSAKGITAVTDDKIPMVYRKFGQPEDQFSFRAYPKGSWVLHMLRSQLGETLYRRCVKTYLERHRFGNVETSDFVRVLEELSGRSFDQFFDQYVYHAQQPDLRVIYEWQERTKLAKVSISQEQKLSEDVLLFSFPATLRFRGAFGTIDREVKVQEKVEEFYVPLPQAPETVRFDPKLALLAKVSFDLPRELLLAQLADRSDPIGRVLAIEGLAKQTDVVTVSNLTQVLNGDSFYGVRIEASKALRRINTPESREALRKSLRQDDARVRRQVLADAAGPYQEESLQVLLQSLTTEKNPDIQSSALTALGTYSRPELRSTLLQNLNTNSYRALLSDAALSAIRLQDDPSYINPVLSALRENSNRWPTPVFSRGLELVAYLARAEEKKDAVRELLLGQLESLKDRVQLAAIRSLKILADPKAIGPLQRFTSLSKEDPIRIAADQSLSDLYANKRPSAELGGVRTDLLSLQQENRDLKKELNSLKEKVEALGAKPSREPSRSKVASPSKPPLPPR